MESVRSFVRRGSVLLGVFCFVCSMTHAQATPQVTEPYGVPPILTNTETQNQHEMHFLTFIGSYVPESVTTANAYYNAIDPTASKRTFPQWLVNAGFIQNTSQWHPTGKQIAACDLPGCDLPSHINGVLTYGDNIINTDSHAILLNAADLGFVRNQYIRCKPSCSALNPTIYTYLENYPVNPFASGTNGSHFPVQTAYPTQAEAAAAIASALNRPLGSLVTNPLDGSTCNTTDTPFACSIQRIADVAFEWAPPPSNPSSPTRYGQLYSYIFSADGSGIGDQVHTRETITVPPAGFAPVLAGKEIPDFVNGGLTTIGANDPFPPNLDFLGFKQHPGVCFTCHGGKPQNLDSTGAYPRQGHVDGFRLLPLDIRNLLFTSDAGSEATSRTSQELQIKQYNVVVLKTVPLMPQYDDQGILRVPHLREVITGWYTDPGSLLFSRTTQNGDFIPKGWREPADGGTAPAGSEMLYKQVVSPSCRSCHFNRELSLDFGTYQNFKQESDLKELVLLPACTLVRPGLYNPDPNKRPMPLAHLTYTRLWQANASTGGTTQTLSGNFQISNTADQIAQYFGYSSVAAYCATNP